jgi:hypothetical protein
LKTVSGKDFARLLEKHGWELKRVTGDTFLVQVYKNIARHSQERAEQLAVLDLLIACCESPPSKYVDYLKAEKNISEIVAVYGRLVALYYSRCHRSEEKARVREAMREIRKLPRGFTLPTV